MPDYKVPRAKRRRMGLHGNRICKLCRPAVLMAPAEVGRKIIKGRGEMLGGNFHLR